MHLYSYLSVLFGGPYERNILSEWSHGSRSSATRPEVADYRTHTPDKRRGKRIAIHL